ncbi:MAG: glycosyltransferase [Cyanobacteria bacterium J06632_3]
MMLSTPVGPLGSGLGGGVELTVTNLAKVLVEESHQITIVTPAGNTVESIGLDLLSHRIRIVQIPGTLQPVAQGKARSDWSAASPVLANMWHYALQHHDQYDLLVNFAYDWLPFYLTPFFSKPIAHFVSMSSLSDRIDDAIALIAQQFPGTLGAYTRSQAKTFSTLNQSMWQILGGGIDTLQYTYCNHPGHALAWVGRISPEKGLEDAIEAAIEAYRPLKIFGKLENVPYWQGLQSKINRARATALVEYCGFLSTQALQQALGQCAAILMTPKWTEAFGLVATEALACGVPVIAYARGGPAEIVRSGETGWLVTPDSVEGLVDAIAKLDQISRRKCRLLAESLYGLPAWGQRFEQWFYQILSDMIIS